MVYAEEAFGLVFESSSRSYERTYQAGAVWPAIWLGSAADNP